jgi:hypothetical protein
MEYGIGERDLAVQKQIIGSDTVEKLYAYRPARPTAHSAFPITLPKFLSNG